MVERGIRIVGMMDYIDANSNIFFEYSLRAQGIFEEVVSAHRNEKGPCHRPHRLFGYKRLTQVRYNVVGYPSFLAQADGGYVDFSGE